MHAHDFLNDSGHDIPRFVVDQNGTECENPFEETRQATTNPVHVDCLISTQEQRPMENGTANVFLTSALTPSTLAVLVLVKGVST